MGGDSRLYQNTASARIDFGGDCYLPDVQNTNGPVRSQLSIGQSTIRKQCYVAGNECSNISSLPKSGSVYWGQAMNWIKQLIILWKGSGHDHVIEESQSLNKQIRISIEKNRACLDGEDFWMKNNHEKVTINGD